MNEIYIQYINILVHQSGDTCIHTNVPSLSPSLISIFVSPPPFFIYSYIFLILILLSLSIFLFRDQEKRREKGGEKEKGSVWQIWYWRFAVEARLYAGRGGVQACCGRNSVMNTYARVKWWLLICSIRNIWRPMKCRIEQRAAERYDRQELWAPTQSPAVSI